MSFMIQSYQQNASHSKTAVHDGIDFHLYDVLIDKPEINSVCMREVCVWERWVYPRLGLHPSLESACAVITVSNKWEDAFEEDDECVCARVIGSWSSPLPSLFLLRCHLSCPQKLSPSAGSTGQSLCSGDSGISHALKVIYHISRRWGYALGKTDAIR